MDCGEGSEAERYEAPLILVRPDQFVAWVGTDASASSARQALGQSVGAAATSPARAAV